MPQKTTKTRMGKIQPETTTVWTKRLLKRRQKLIKAGDDKGLCKLELGRFICSMRLSEKRTQLEAADFADIGRCQWNRIEMGHVLPHLSTLERISEAIRTDISRLKERGGYPRPKVPLEVGQAFRRFRTSIEHSRSTVEFLSDMCLLWQEFKAEELGMRKGWEINSGLLEAVAFVKTRLPVRQQLQLIFALADSLSPQQWRLAEFDRRSFIQLIDRRLSERRMLKELVEEYEGSQARKGHSES
jgi:transcriptional regulator with XRE-family HTH domain